MRHTVTLFSVSDLVCIRLSILWLLINFILCNSWVIILLKIYKPTFLLIKHPCSIRAWVPVSFLSLSLSFFLSLSLSHFLIDNSRPPGSSPLKDPNICMISHAVMSNSFATLWTEAHQAPLSRGFSRHEYWSGLPYPPPGHLPDPQTEPISLMSPTLAGRFFTTSATWEAQTWS